MKEDTKKTVDKYIKGIADYLVSVQVMDKKSKFYGSFYSEKAYHYPALDYNAGGAHHYRTVGSAGLSFLLLSKLWNRKDLAERAEIAFDWVVKQQCEDGGFYEISNNDIPSLHGWSKPDNSKRYSYPRSTISMAIIVHGLSQSILKEFLLPKDGYIDCLKKAAEWQLSVERPKGSGVFVHDESHLNDDKDCLNANTFGALTLANVYKVLEKIKGIKEKQFLETSERAIYHTIGCQEENGEFRYLAHEGRTIAYTGVVADCLLKIRSIIPVREEVKKAIAKSCNYLKKFIKNNGKIDWEIETSASKYGTGTYIKIVDIFAKLGYLEDSYKLIRYCDEYLYDAKANLLSVKDIEKERIYHATNCQADFLLLLLEMVVEQNVIV